MVMSLMSNQLRVIIVTRDKWSNEVKAWGVPHTPILPRPRTHKSPPPWPADVFCALHITVAEIGQH